MSYHDDDDDFFDDPAEFGHFTFGGSHSFSPSSDADGPKLKLGRCCFTCRFRLKRTGHFVSCKYNKGKTIWDKARCPKWALTLNKKQLCQLEKSMDGRQLSKTIKTRRMYYGRNPNADDQEAYADKLGRCCFTCVHRAERDGHMLLCTRFDPKVWVWDKAQCRRWVLTKDV